MSRLRETSDQPGQVLHSLGADKSAFVQRLQTILAHWPSADRLARTMGVSPSAFRKWLKGEAEPSRERLVALARATGVGVAWLAEGEGPPPAFDAPGARRRPRTSEPESVSDLSHYTFLPEQPETFGSSSISRYLGLRHEWVRAVCGVEPEHILIDLARDGSMSPTVEQRDTMLIDSMDRDMQSCGVYLLEIDGQRLVRRVQRKHDGSLALITDNAKYENDLVEADFVASIGVIGRVVWVGGPV